MSRHVSKVDAIEPTFVTARLTALIQELVDEADSTNGALLPRAHNTDGERIVLDVKVNGMRCVLMRLPADVSARSVPLSPREREIVRMVANGHPNKVIAAVLNISPWTVCTHLRRIFVKMGVASRAAMIARFLDLESYREPGGQTAIDDDGTLLQLSNEQSLSRKAKLAAG